MENSRSFVDRPLTACFLLLILSIGAFAFSGALFESSPQTISVIRWGVVALNVLGVGACFAGWVLFSSGAETTLFHLVATDNFLMIAILAAYPLNVAALYAFRKFLTGRKAA